MRNPLRTGKLPEATPIRDDGDELHFCSTCVFGSVCLPNGVDKQALAELHMLVEHTGPFDAGQPIFRTGDEFTAIYAVRSGMVKTCLVDEGGREQVLGFHLPGEVIGLNAIHAACYPCDAVSLDNVQVCCFSFPALSVVATRIPDVQQRLFGLMSAAIGRATQLAGDHPADERLAAFLTDLSDRYAARGFLPNALRLAMPRSDIANYLRLAAETVSRVLRRFQDGKLIRIDGRRVELLEPERLRELGRSVMHQ